MRSFSSSVGGSHSKALLTRRLSVGSVSAGSTAPTQRNAENRYSTPEDPGHCPLGSLEVPVNGPLPMVPMFVTFIHRLLKVVTLPGPMISGGAVGRSEPAACVDPETLIQGGTDSSGHEGPAHAGAE